MIIENHEVACPFCGQTGIHSCTGPVTQQSHITYNYQNRQGWSCPGCGSAHSPDVQTCPNTTRYGTVFGFGGGISGGGIGGGSGATGGSIS